VVVRRPAVAASYVLRPHVNSTGAKPRYRHAIGESCMGNNARKLPESLIFAVRSRRLSQRPLTCRGKNRRESAAKHTNSAFSQMQSPAF